MKSDDLNQNEQKALRCIRNALVHFGMSPSVREIMRSLGYQSPRSAALIIESLVEKGAVSRREDGSLRVTRDYDGRNHTHTVDVPLIGVVACGAPILATESIEAYIPVSTSLAKPGHKYFMLRASGDSMDEAGIKDGDLILVRRQQTADDGERVVALIDDEATVKELRHGDGVTILYPRSSNKKHQPIVLEDDFIVQGVAIATVPGELPR